MTDQQQKKNIYTEPLKLPNDHIYKVPVKVITNQQELNKFLESDSCRNLLSFIQRVGEVVECKPNSYPCNISQTCTNILEAINTMSGWIDEIPPLAQPMRYGNKAYRTWYQKLIDNAQSLHESILPLENHNAIPELIPYLQDSMGNQTRLDYGTGHELHFVVWIYCLRAVGCLTIDDELAFGLKIFPSYLELVRKLQRVYGLEPAGTHGVWSLDDYQFIPFIWGAAQLIDHKTIKPTSILDKNIVDQNYQDYMYLACIKYINTVKKGPFHEHSPDLYNISGAASWAKIHAGMKKKFYVDVMSKGFSIRRSNFLVPILSNNIIVTGEEAVSFEKPLPYKESTTTHSQQQSSSSQQQQQDKKAVSACAFSPESPECKQQQQPTQSTNHRVGQREDNLPIKVSELSDQEIIDRILTGEILAYKLESELGDCQRAVEIRRILIQRNINKELPELPFQHYDFAKVQGTCCENVIGYVPIPVGTAGPLLLNGAPVTIPMATTEGCLVASTHRGCRAISESGGAICKIISRGMTRAPVVRFTDISKATEFVQWLNIHSHYEQVKLVFDQTSRFARLTGIKTTLAGRSVYIRFKCDTGDAMGMNMVSKGVEAVLDHLKTMFHDFEVISISGNYCTDKKPSSINWIEGRGRTVVCEAVITGDIVEKVLKTNVQALVDLNISKNLVGSAMAGSIGGFNAHASNIVTAVFLATGQDCAQNVESSNCITLMESCNEGKDLYITVTMPSIEVGTVGGGTSLPAQASCLDIIGVRGSQPGKPGVNADQLAKTICGAVMAGELSLMSALAAGHLMKSHLRYNRAKTSTSSS
eukprot:gene4770-5950_t